MQLFLVPVTLSRVFLYAYDLVEVQASARSCDGNPCTLSPLPKPFPRSLNPFPAP